MALFGIGAYYYEGDVSERFIKGKVAFIGWDEQDAPAIHQMFKSIKVGDIIFIKSQPIGGNLTIKAIGIVTNNKIHSYNIHGVRDCLKAKWLWTGEYEFDKIEDKYNVRKNTLFEEFNPDVQEQVLKLLFTKLSAD